MTRINGIKAHEWQEENHPEDGVLKVYWENKVLRWEIPYKNGKKEGESKGFFKNGQLKSIWNWKAGDRVGLRTEWYETGQKRFEGHVKAGELYIMNSWTPTGEPMVKEGNGFQIFWFNSEKKSAEGDIKNGLKEGQWIEWYKNGSRKGEKWYNS